MRFTIRRSGRLHMKFQVRDAIGHSHRREADVSHPQERVERTGSGTLRGSVVSAICGMALLSGSGCQLAYFGMSDRQQAIPAEYTKLAGKTVAVVVWADQATLDLDPYARHNVGVAVTYHMGKALPRARFIRSADVDELQESSGSEWETWSAAELCRRLKCDRIVRIDLLEYTTRAHASTALRRGRISGTVAIFGDEETSGTEALYSGDITAMFPPETGTTAMDWSDTDILHQTVEDFGGAVAMKFYDHQIPYTRTREH